mmetsp:Transcript_5559/g.23096  ORF Transcript_5559/g.23096 Transcript_5559/m.23096 type:complete len:208 (-) Transcript_5559:1369-1992(-)
MLSSSSSVSMAPHRPHPRRPSNRGRVGLLSSERRPPCGGGGGGATTGGASSAAKTQAEASGTTEPSSAPKAVLAASQTHAAPFRNRSASMTTSLSRMPVHGLDALHRIAPAPSGHVPPVAVTASSVTLATVHRGSVVAQMPEPSPSGSSCCCVPMNTGHEKHKKSYVPQLNAPSSSSSSRMRDLFSRGGTTGGSGNGSSSSSSSSSS